MSFKKKKDIIKMENELRKKDNMIQKLEDRLKKNTKINSKHIPTNSFYHNNSNTSKTFSKDNKSFI